MLCTRVQMQVKDSLLVYSYHTQQKHVYANKYTCQYRTYIHCYNIHTSRLTLTFITTMAMKTGNGSANTTFSPEPENVSLETKIVQNLAYYYPLILLVCGCVGNILSFIVFSKKSLSSSGTALLFRVLAIMDSLVLNSALWADIVYRIGGVEWVFSTHAGCKAFAYTVLVSKCLAVSVLTLVTIERIIGVNIPHRAKSLCTKRNFKIALILIGITEGSVYSFVIVATGSVHLTDKNGNLLRVACSLRNNPATAWIAITVWPWIDFSLSCGIPFTIMLLGNISIIYRLFQSNKKHQQISRQVSDERDKSEQQRLTNLTVMLLTISIGFLVCTCPYSAYYLSGIYPNTPPLYLWWYSSQMLSFTNHGINFFCYTISGSHFRQELRSLCCK